MIDKVLITSALPYANAPLHFGHIAGAYLPGDCYARFERLMGKNVLYVCGSDEHGVAITLSAEMANRTPKEHVDLYHQTNLELFNQLNFSFDHFSRTTWEGHKQPTIEFFQDLQENGFIEEKVTDQLYSEEDDKFLADRYVIGTCPKCGYDKARGDECQSCGASYEAVDLKNPKSKLTGSSLTMRPTKHWFIRLDLFKDKLLDWLKTKNWKPNVVNFVKDYIENLHPRAITRDSKWGIPLPVEDSEGKVFYVWFDAPIGYISASMEWSQKQGNPDLWKEFWQDPKTKLVQFIGKDNIPFHAAIFPAMVMGQNQPYKIVDELPANEFYNLEGRKFSKSDQWTIDLKTFFEKYSADQIRYTIAANAPETSDSEFTWKDFQSRCNADLLGKYGNLVNRVLVFAERSCNGTIPEPMMEEEDTLFLEKVSLLTEEIKLSFQTFKLRRASRLLMEIAQAGNSYFDHKKPWQDLKDPSLKKRMETTIYCCLECIKALAFVSYPLIPTSAEKVWYFIGYSNKISDIQWDQALATSLEIGKKLEKPERLFRKIEDKEIADEVEKLKKMVEKEEKKSTVKEIVKVPLKENISFEEFASLDLRVGKILSAKAMKKSKKLYLLEVDLGFEKRQIVSGIREYYQEDTLVGKSVIVVANLAPKKLMGVESQGMILAAADQDNLELLFTQKSSSGSLVS